MLLDSTVGNILRKTHKPAQAHRIPQNNQTFITSVMNTEVINTRNSYHVFGWEKKMHIFRHVLVTKADVQTQVTPQYTVRKLI